VGPDPAGRASVIVVGYSSKPEGRAALRRAIVHTSPELELADLRGELAATGIPHRITGSEHVEDPAEELINAAESAGADFIVIGLRRRSPVGKRLLGSNAQRVLLDASCPVLAVKAEPEN
jgi:nucleotide-binding universal stress UspA family protein